MRGKTQRQTVDSAIGGHGDPDDPTPLAYFSFPQNVQRISLTAGVTLQLRSNNTKQQPNMRYTLTTIAALLFAASILLAGNGLQATLLSVRANIDGFSLSQIGFLLSSYYVGFIAGCHYAPQLVARVGHIRTFTALASLASAIALGHILIVDPEFWLVLRLVSGFCFAGLHMIIESWINEQATNENRGTILSVYRIVDLTAVTLGQFLLIAADPAHFALFAMTSILISLSIIPIALSTSSSPAQVKGASLNLKKLFHVSPLASVGCFCVGAANGSFWGIGPVFVQQIGYDLTAVATFMSAVIVGGAVSQLPLGLLSDKIDRRIVIIIVSIFSAASGLFLATVGTSSQFALLAGAVFFGSFAMPLFGLNAAHANDHAEEGEFVAVSGGLFLLFGAGAIIGPILAPVFMGIGGPSALFQFTAGVHCLLAGFGLFRMLRRVAPSAQEKSDYIPIPRTTPEIFEIDPRNPLNTDE